MTHYLSKRVGKLLFPHLARDQRKHQMAMLSVVLTFTIVVGVTVAMMMIRLGTRR